MAFPSITASGEETKNQNNRKRVSISTKQAHNAEGTRGTQAAQDEAGEGQGWPPHCDSGTPPRFYFNLNFFCLRNRFNHLPSKATVEPGL